MSASSPSLVQAMYSFKGRNNDELCFEKGDIITITQKEEGGWWEGTLSGVTGWFPSNYVKEHVTQGLIISDKTTPGENLSGQQKMYRKMVIKDLIDSERAHVAELKTLFSNFLEPLYKSEILTKEEYRQLIGNLETIIELHTKLLCGIEASWELPPQEQRVGKLFITTAPALKQAHIAYCSSHPRAVCVLNKHKEALNNFMEMQGAASPGLLVLTTGLSKPFRRLEKYSGIMLELERHMEENHVDRGDTQRSFAVYRDIWSACLTTRRQKEQELEVLTGRIRGWEGEELTTLGEILHMGSVAVGPDYRDRYLVLFPSTLLILSVSSRMSGFIYEGKLPLSGITVNALPDTDTCKNSLEITGPLIDRIVAVCQTRDEQQAWLESLKNAIRLLQKNHLAAASANGQIRLNKIQKNTNESSPWSVTHLKPLPPLRPCVELGTPKKGKTALSPKKSVDINFEEDIQILRVIEAYCSRTNPNSSNVMSGLPSSINGRRVSMAVKEKYVLDAIDLFRNELSDMSKKVNDVAVQLDEEIKTRTELQNVLQAHLTDSSCATKPT